MKKIDSNVLLNTHGGAPLCQDKDLAAATVGAAFGGALFFGPIGAIGAVIGSVAYIKLICERN